MWPRFCHQEQKIQNVQNETNTNLRFSGKKARLCLSFLRWKEEWRRALLRESGQRRRKSKNNFCIWVIYLGSQRLPWRKEESTY